MDRLSGEFRKGRHVAKILSRYSFLRVFLDLFSDTSCSTFSYSFFPIFLFFRRFSYRVNVDVFLLFRFSATRNGSNTRKVEMEERDRGLDPLIRDTSDQRQISPALFRRFEAALRASKCVNWMTLAQSSTLLRIYVITIAVQTAAAEFLVRISSAIRGLDLREEICTSVRATDQRMDDRGIISVRFQILVERSASGRIGRLTERSMESRVSSSK